MAFSNNDGGIKDHQNIWQLQFPHLILEWDHENNGGRWLYDFLPGSHYMAAWKCTRFDDHRWSTAIKARTRRQQPTNCPFCSGHRVPFADSLENTHPDIAYYFATGENGRYTTRNIKSTGNYSEMVWRCAKNEDHRFLMGVRTRVRNGVAGLCKECLTKDAEETLIKERPAKRIRRRLVDAYPDIAAQWIRSKNGDAELNSLMISSKNVCVWKCHMIPEHQYEMTVSDRVKPSGNCRLCTVFLRRSRIEIAFAFELHAIFCDIDPRSEVFVDGWSRGAIDIALSKWRIAVEYDGSTYHNNAEAEDRTLRKRRALAEAGWTMICVRSKRHDLGDLDVQISNTCWWYERGIWRDTITIARHIIERCIRPRIDALLLNDENDDVYSENIDQLNDVLARLVKYMERDETLANNGMADEYYREILSRYTALKCQ